MSWFCASLQICAKRVPLWRSDQCSVVLLWLLDLSNSSFLNVSLLAAKQVKGMLRAKYRLVDDGLLQSLEATRGEDWLRSWRIYVGSDNLWWVRLT